MSADTYLYIDKKFKVWMCTASCVCRHTKHCLSCQKSNAVGQGKNMKEAVKIANKYDLKNPMNIEYGMNTFLWCK